jgi:putative transposase
MPRRPRLHVEGGFYHVILRGNHRQSIFFRPADRDRFAELVSEMIERFRMRVHAFCWMRNHVHLLMQVSDVPLGRAMMRIASRFAREMQKQQPTTGHFFERRYRAILVDADSYLLELIRYIHLNAVRANIVADPAEYRWSGHRAYLGLEELPWLTTDFALSLFSRELGSAREAYRRFVLAGIGWRDWGQVLQSSISMRASRLLMVE